MAASVVRQLRITACFPRPYVDWKSHEIRHVTYNLPLTASLKKINWWLSKSFVLWFFALL